MQASRVSCSSGSISHVSDLPFRKQQHHFTVYPLQNVEFWAVNTDKQALDSNICSNKLQIGIELTRGLGTGGKPSLGEQAAQESVEDINKVVSGADMLFITAGKQ